MVKGVAPVSLIQTLVKGADKAKREAGDYKDIEGDYERLPLLIIGCFCLLAAKWQQGSHRWEHVVDFWQIGDKVSSLCDYWEIVDLVQNSSRMLSSAWPLFVAFDLTSEIEREKGLEAAKKTTPYACKTFSNLINLFETLVEFKILKGMNIHKWKIAGSLVGSAGYAHNFYTDWTEDTNLVESEVKETARETYRRQHQKQKFCDLTILVSILAGKIIGFGAAVQALNGATRVTQFISDHKEDLLLAAYATYTTMAIGSTYYDLQMKELEKQKGKTCQTN